MKYRIGFVKAGGGEVGRNGGKIVDWLYDMTGPSSKSVPGWYTNGGDLNDFTVINSKSANWTIDSGNPTFFAGDAARVTRTAADAE